MKKTWGLVLVLFSLTLYGGYPPMSSVPAVRRYEPMADVPPAKVTRKKIPSDLSSSSKDRSALTGKPKVTRAVKPAVKQVSKPILKQAGKQPVAPVEKPVVKPVEKPVVKPVEKPVVKPTENPVADQLGMQPETKAVYGLMPPEEKPEPKTEQKESLYNRFLRWLRGY